MNGIFITGTDTGVGKTVITATLCRILRTRGIDAVALKPFATGLGPDTLWQDNDPLLLSAAMDYVELPEDTSSVRLSAALSPYDAARFDGTNIDIDAVLLKTRQAAARHSFAIIEGVGGVCVPLTKTISVLNFAKQLHIPALVVSRSGIGTINHTLLTVAALRQARVPIEGIIFSRLTDGPLTLAEEYGTETAQSLADTTSFGMVQHSPAIKAAKDPDAFAKALPTGDAAINAIADRFLFHAQSGHTQDCLCN